MDFIGLSALLYNSSPPRLTRAYQFGGFFGPHYFSYFQDQNTLISNGKPTFENATALNLATLGLLEPAIDARAMAKGNAHFGHHNTYGLQVFDDKTYESIMQTIEDPKEGCYTLIDICRALVAEGDPERFGNNKTVNAACVAATSVWFGKLQGIYSLLSDVSTLIILIEWYEESVLTMCSETPSTSRTPI